MPKLVQDDAPAANPSVSYRATSGYDSTATGSRLYDISRATLGGRSGIDVGRAGPLRGRAGSRCASETDGSSGQTTRSNASAGRIRTGPPGHDRTQTGH